MDKLGILAPVTTRAVWLFFIQQLWRQKIDRDDPLVETFVEAWVKFRKELNQLSILKFPKIFTHFQEISSYTAFVTHLL